MSRVIPLRRMILPARRAVPEICSHRGGVPAGAARGSRLRSWLRLACALSVVFGAAQASAACVRLNPGDQDMTIRLTMPNLDLPDRRFLARSDGGVVDAFRCDAGQSAFHLDLPLTGLTYEREIAAEDGRTYSVYSLGPRSPLIGFMHSVTTRHNSNHRSSQRAVTVGAPFLNQGIVSNADEPLDVDMYVMLFFRGGAMESIPMTHLGTATSWSDSDPSQRIQHHIRLEVNVPVLTCTLSDTARTLDPVSADQLAVVGSDAGEKPVVMSMSCPSANIDVEMVLADANDAGNRGSVLAPASGSDAGGVRVEMLRDGSPVQFGQSWRHGGSSKGSQDIPFTARYVRTSDRLQPGQIVGEAVLTATYR
ncbi:F17e-G fimbrial adhesin precursor [compost metagenome]